MDKYYYLASQLPLLTFNQKTDWDKDRFLQEAQKWVSDKDRSALLETSLDHFDLSKGTNKYLKEYKRFERNLREELAGIRRSSDKVKQKEINIFKGFNWDRTPLEIEIDLLRLRWQFIEDKEEEHYFDIGFLIYYFLKLQILEKLFVFDKEKGTANFDNLCEVKG